MEIRRQLSSQLSPSTVGSEDTTQVLIQAWVVSAFLPAEVSCRPLTGSLCGAGESNGGPGVYSKCLTDGAISSAYHYNFLRDLTIPSNFTSPITAAMLVQGTSVSLFVL